MPIEMVDALRCPNYVGKAKNVIQLNVDDKSAEREAFYKNRLWEVVKTESLPETIFVRFPNGRYVRLRVEEWTDTMPTDPFFTMEEHRREINP